MPNYIRIEGTKEQLLNLTGIGGLQLRQRSAAQIESGKWQVYAFATTDAITEVQNRGAVVEILKNQEEIDKHLAKLDDYIGEDKGIA